MTPPAQRPGDPHLFWTRHDGKTGCAATGFMFFGHWPDVKLSVLGRTVTRSTRNTLYLPTDERFNGPCR